LSFPGEILTRDYGECTFRTPSIERIKFYRFFSESPIEKRDRLEVHLGARQQWAEVAYRMDV